MLIICKKHQIDIYGYLSMQAIHENKLEHFKDLATTIKELSTDLNLYTHVLLPLERKGFIIIHKDGSVILTESGKSLFANNDSVYLSGMLMYPKSITVHGTPYPAHVPDKRCIELMKQFTPTEIDDIKKAIIYGKSEGLLNMKFDKFIESKYYDVLLEKMNESDNRNSIYDNNF